jgi:hypothetical protein
MINGANIGWQLGSAKKLRAARGRYICLWHETDLPGRPDDVR